MMSIIELKCKVANSIRRGFPFTAEHVAAKQQHASLRVVPSVKDEKVYAVVAKSLLSYTISVPNFWNVIYAKLFVK